MKKILYIICLLVIVSNVFCEENDKINKGQTMNAIENIVKKYIKLWSDRDAEGMYELFHDADDDKKGFIKQVAHDFKVGYPITIRKFYKPDITHCGKFSLVVTDITIKQLEKTSDNNHAWFVFYLHNINNNWYVVQHHVFWNLPEYNSNIQDVYENYSNVMKLSNLIENSFKKKKLKDIYLLHSQPMRNNKTFDIWKKDIGTKLLNVSNNLNKTYCTFPVYEDNKKITSAIIFYKVDLSKYNAVKITYNKGIDDKWGINDIREYALKDISLINKQKSLFTLFSSIVKCFENGEVYTIFSYLSDSLYYSKNSGHKLFEIINLFINPPEALNIDIKPIFISSERATSYMTITTKNLQEKSMHVCINLDFIYEDNSWSINKIDFQKK